MSLGSCTNALAMAQRCFSPPESSLTCCDALCEIAAISMLFAAICLIVVMSSPELISGAMTFSSTLNDSKRLKCWKINPILFARYAEACRSGSLEMSSPSTTIFPLLGLSSAATSERSVDFPLPLTPLKMTVSPLATSRSIDLSASKACAVPSLNILWTFSIRIITALPLLAESLLSSTQV